MSWVFVTVPSRIPAMYSFSADSKNSTPRVARPMKMGSTPVAIGSSVPPCPMRFSWNTPRSFAATSWLVQPPGLSTIKIPFAISALPDNPALRQQRQNGMPRACDSTRNRRACRCRMPAAAQSLTKLGGVVVF